MTDLERVQHSLDIAALEKENMRWELTVEKKNLELEKKNVELEKQNVELENDRLPAALEKTTDELALVQLNAVHFSMRSFLERFLKKCVEVLVNSDRVSARDKKLLKSNSMSAINGVVERHWSLVAALAAFFPECSCVPRFPRPDKGGLLYGKLSQRVHNPMLNVIFLPEEPANSVQFGKRAPRHHYRGNTDLTLSAAKFWSPRAFLHACVEL